MDEYPMHGDDLINFVPHSEEVSGERAAIVKSPLLVILSNTIFQSPKLPLISDTHTAHTQTSRVLFQAIFIEKLSAS